MFQQTVQWLNEEAEKNILKINSLQQKLNEKDEIIVEKDKILRRYKQINDNEIKQMIDKYDIKCKEYNKLEKKI